MIRYVCLFYILACLPIFLAAQDVLLVEDFESGVRPTGWTQQRVRGDDVDGSIVEWKFDVEEGHNSQPGPDPFRGKIARFDYQSPNGVATKLITRRLELKNRVKPELSFYHAQKGWNKGIDDDVDELRIYLKTGEDKPWIMLAEYVGEVPVWTHQKVNIADSLLTDSVYIAFEGTSRWGNGVCVDSVVVRETDVMDRYVSELEVIHPTADLVPGGTQNNPMLRILLKVVGNSGQALLESLSVSSLNTDDDVIAPEGVKIYYTPNTVFQTNELLGSGADFVGGLASFNSLNKELVTGNNYIWVTYDVVDSNDFQGAILDAFIDAFDIRVSDSLLPDVPYSPPGQRVYFQSLFFDDFETLKGWTFPQLKDSLGEDLPNEFEIDTTCGPYCEELLGGRFGNPNPQYAYSGRYVLGSDVSGQGDYPGDYESSLLQYQYTAVSPTIDCFYFNQVQLIFKRWLNVYLLDHAGIEVSVDNGETWQPLWLNVPSGVSDNQWSTRSYNLGNLADRQREVKIRFYLGPTQAFNNNYSGWNIDDLIITGNYVQQDVGVSSWVSPVDGCGHSATDTVKVWVKNFGAEDVTDDIPLKYSFSGAVNVEVYDTLFGGIPYQDSVLFAFRTPVDLSVPYFYDDTQIYTTTLFPGDEDNRNDKVTTSLRVVPTHKPPYVEDFEQDFGYWTVLGEDNVWAHGTPGGTIIDDAASGSYAWVTNLYGFYNPGDSIYVESPCYDLSGITNPVLQMEISSRLNPGLDGVAVQYSIDDGETWDVVPTHAYPYHWNWYNADSIDGLGGPGWDTTYQDWTTARQFLPLSTAGQPRVKFRIGLESAGDDFREGFGFDDFTVFEAPNDLGVTQLVYPHDTCDLSPSEEVLLAIKNYGIDVLSVGDSFMVEVRVNHDQVVRDTVYVSQDVAVGDTFHYKMSGTFDMYLAGNYHVKATTISFVDDNIYADTLYNNDSIFDSVLVYKPYVFFGPDIYTVRPDTLVLDAYSDAGNLYTWQDGSSDSAFQVQDSGLYYVEVLNPNTLCTAHDTIFIHRLIADYGVTALHNMASDCEIGDSVPIMIEVMNYGTDTLRYGYSIDFSYQVDGVAAVRETWLVPDTVRVYPDSSFVYVFNQALDMSQVLVYDFLVYTDFPYDDSTHNDSLSMSIEVYGYPDFELFPSDTIHQGFSFLLDAKQGNADWVEFAWHDGSTDSVFLVTEQGTGMYYSTVTDVYGCSSSDSSRVRLVIVDVEVAAIYEPLESCGAMVNRRVSIEVVNAGTDTLFPGTVIPVYYAFDTLPLQEDSVVLAARFEPGDSLFFEFDVMVSYGTTGVYELLVYAALHNDSVPINDTLALAVYLHELPHLDLGADTLVLNKAKHTIAPGNYQAYAWSDGSSDSVFVVDYRNWFQRVYLTVTDSNDCQASDDVKVDLDFLNLAIDTLMLDDTICVLVEGMPLTLRVANKGTQVIPGYMIRYSFNENDTLEIPVANALGILATRQHTLYANAEESVLDTYSLYVDLEVTGSFYTDIVPEDDIVSRAYYLYGLPEVLWNTPADDTLALELAFPYALGLAVSYESYVWGDSVSLDTNLVVYEDGWYQVRVMDANGCFNTDSIYVLGPIGIDHHLYGSLSVHYYPVPVTDVLHLELAVEHAGTLVLDILSLQGQRLYSRTVEVLDETVELIDVSGFASGVYLLQVRGRDLFFSGKLIVE